jgi:sugar transferase (PEP-CTERM/EpsH1 system associated)
MQDLLYLVHRFPYPPNKGDKIRSYHLLKFLSERYRVHLGCFIDDVRDRQHIPKLMDMCASSCFIEQRPLLATLRSLSALVSREAMSLPYYRSKKLQHWVNLLLASGQVHQALAFSGPMAQYLYPLPAEVILRRVIDFVDVDSEKWRQYAAAKCWPLARLYRREARYLLAYERYVTQQFDSATFVSSAEATLFCQRARRHNEQCQYEHKISFFNNGVDADYFSPQQNHRNPYPDAVNVLVFTGAMDYWPNVEAVLWFASRVLPALRMRFPTLQFHIVGSRPTEQVTALRQIAGITVTGAVPDIRPYLAHATVAVAPLRIARGIQNKVLEAMSMEKIVVASQQAAEGISVVPGIEIVVAANENEFIGHLTCILAGNLSYAMGQAARRRVLQDYCWEKNLTHLGTIMSDQCKQLKQLP